MLNLVVAERIMGLKPDATEGELSKLMNQLVNYHACAEAARRAGLRDALRVDASATKVGARDNDRVLGDACEALIAALYLDAGIATARAFVLGLLGRRPSRPSTRPARTPRPSCRSGPWRAASPSPSTRW